MVCQDIRDWLGGGDSRSWDDAVCGVYSTQCMLYSVYACTWCMLYSVLTIDQCMKR